MTALMLPTGRGERRTRLYDDRYTELLYDSATSDEHPHDFMRSRGLREANAVIDFHNVVDPGSGRPARWSGKICQRSRRRFENIGAREYLRFLMVTTNPFLPAAVQWPAYREHFAQPNSPYTVVDMYGIHSTPARWAPVVEPGPLQLGFSGNSPIERAWQAVQEAMPELIAQGLI